MSDQRSKSGGKGGSNASQQASTNEADQLKSFLVSLATDPARLGAFIKDPDAEMEAAGVPESGRAVLKSGNPAAIYGAISGQPAQPPVYPQILVIVMDAATGADGETQLTLRGQPAAMYPMILPSGGQTGLLQVVMPHFPNFPIYQPQIFQPIQLIPLQLVPQITPQIFSPQVGGGPPQLQIAPQVVFPVIYPQVGVPPQIQPQLVVQPQVHPQIVQPQIHPQLVVQPQIHPQIVQPQIQPQLVVQPQIFPQVVPPQIQPQLVVQPQIYPQVIVAPQIQPQLVVQPQIYPQLVVPPQIQPQLVVQPMVFTGGQS